MTDLFLTILNMSLSATWLVAAVVILRLLLKKAPRWIHVVLWGLVAFRLVCPFTLESALSLIPSAEVVPPDIAMSPAPAIHTGIEAVNSAVNPVIQESFTPDPVASVNPLQVWLAVAANLWILGACAMAAYAVISYWRLRRRVRMAIRVKKNIYLSEYVDSPFVLGIFKPRIYLPYHMPELDRYHVLAHERTHIRRKDHWWKPLGYLLLTIHWFNPLMWLAYILLCRDIEMACDEKVIKELGSAQRADYSQALLNCSAHRNLIAACPVAFGEVGVKERVKNVLNYKKPAFWVIVIAVIACIVVAVCFLTDPKMELSFMGKPITYAVALDSETTDTTGMLELNEEELSFLSQCLSELDSIEDYTGTEYDDFRYRYYLRIEPEGCDPVQVYVMSWDTGPVVLEYQQMLYEIKDDAFSELLLRLYNRGFIVPSQGKDCGITIEVSEASSTGMTIYIHEPEYPEDVLVLDDSNYRLQRNDNGFWFDVEDLPESIGYRINCNIGLSEEGRPYKLSWVTRYGKLPAGSYRLLNDYIFITDDNPVRYTVSADFTIPETETWGFTMTAQSATPTGVTLVFSQSPLVRGRYLYGSYYALEVLHSGYWVPMAQLPQEYEVAWTTEGYDPSTTSHQTIDWEWLYGELSPGHYRISKTMSDTQSPENEAITLYAEFTVIDPHVITATLQTADVEWVDVTLERGDSTEYLSLNPEQIQKLVSILNGLKEEEILERGEIRYTARMHLICKESSIVLCSNDGQLSLGVSVPQGGWDSSDDRIVSNKALDAFIAELWELEHLLDPFVGPTYEVTELLYTDPEYEGIYNPGVNAPIYAISEDGHLLAKGEIDSDGYWTDMGKLGTDYLTAQNFDPHFKSEFDAAALRENIQQAWSLHTHNQADTSDVHYRLLQQKNGDLYLVYMHPNLGYADIRWVMKLEPAASTYEIYNVAPLEDLPPNYSLEEATIDQCVIMVDGDIRDNQDVWEDFISKEKDGNAATVRCVRYQHTGTGSSMFLYDVIYDGSSYTLRGLLDGKVFERSFKYLIDTTGQGSGEDGSFDAYQCCYLSNERNTSLILTSYVSDVPVNPDQSPFVVYSDLVYFKETPELPALSKAVLSDNGTEYLTITDATTLTELHSLLSSAEWLGYYPKTPNFGPTLTLYGIQGDMVVLQLDVESDLIAIDGDCFDYGPGYDNFGSNNDIFRLWELMGLTEWTLPNLSKWPDGINQKYFSAEMRNDTIMNRMFSCISFHTNEDTFALTMADGTKADITDAEMDTIWAYLCYAPLDKVYDGGPDTSKAEYSLTIHDAGWNMDCTIYYLGSSTFCIKRTTDEHIYTCIDPKLAEILSTAMA